MTTATELDADLVVVGAGMAGMTAAGYAAQHGARVIVVECANEIGGSAALSSGGLVVSRSFAEFRSLNPSGDPVLGRVLFDGYRVLADWIAATGTRISDVFDAVAILGVPSYARAFDILGYLSNSKAIVEKNGGWVVTNARVESLRVEGGAVIGVDVRDRDGLAVVSSPWTLLSTGGFQNDAELRTRFLGPNAAEMVVRSNHESDGAGLKLGQSVGADLSGPMDRFYGHTMPVLDRVPVPADYQRHAQFYLAPRSVLLDRSGRRFTDEGAGYYVNAQQVLRQPGGRALLVGDNSIRTEDTNPGGFLSVVGAEQVDRITEAKRERCLVVEGDTLAALDAALRPHGYHGVEQAIVALNRLLATNPDALDPPRRKHRRPVVEPPFWAMEVQGAVTFPFGGLRIDADAHVLDAGARPIPGLLAAGADAGGVYYEGYTGGLSMSGVFALRAAEMALQGITQSSPAPPE